MSFLKYTNKKAFSYSYLSQPALVKMCEVQLLFNYRDYRERYFILEKQLSIYSLIL